MAPPLDGAWPQRKGQLQKSDEPQLLILPAREKIPGDEGFRLFAQLGAEAGKDPPGRCAVSGDLLHRVEGSRLPLRGPDREGQLMLGKALKHTAEKALEAAIIEVDHIGIVELPGRAYRALARHCTASSRTIFWAVRGGTP